MRATGHRSSVKLSTRLALVYLAVGAGWIVATDHLMFLISRDDATLNMISSLKGVVFVALSALLILIVVRVAEARDARDRQALAESEERFRLAVAGTREAVWDRDLRGGRIFYSGGGWDLLGYGAGEVLEDASSWAERVHPDDRRRVVDGIERHLAGDGGRYVCEYRARRRDGAYIWIQSCGAVVRDGAGRPVRFVGVDHDISERRIFEERLSRSNRALTALSATNRALIVATSAEGLANAVCRALVDNAGYPLAWMGWLAERPKIAAIAGHAAWVEKEGWGTETGPVAQALAGGHVACAPGASVGEDGPARARLAVPIAVNGTVEAVLSVHAEDAGAFEAREREVFALLARDVGYALSYLAEVGRHAAATALLAEMKRQAAGQAALPEAPLAITPPASGRRLLIDAERSRLFALARIKTVLIDSVTALSLAVEKRDPYTAGHERRVAALSVEIAHHLGLDADRIEGIHLGALMHDIGKLGVPLEILSKPGALSHIEYDLVRQHTLIGLDIVQGIDFPWPIGRMVAEHHERVDGSGYPSGLAGEAIALEARIIAVADVTEAMVSHRPYRPGLGMEAAAAELRRGQGRLYDARAVEACLAIVARPGFTLPGDAAS